MWSYSLFTIVIYMKVNSFKLGMFAVAVLLEYLNFYANVKNCSCSTCFASIAFIVEYRCYQPEAIMTGVNWSY